MKISIIIPTYNRKEILRPLLSSLVSDPHIPAGVELEILVSDDRSKDGTAEMVRQEYPQIRLEEGPAKGLELNKRSAVQKCTGDYIVVLDDDSIPRHGWLAHVVPDLRRGESLVLCKIIFHEQGRRETKDESRENFFFGYRWDLMPVMLNHGGYRPQYVGLCHEFGTFISREVLRKVPLNDPNLWSDFGSSASFYFRASQAGYKVYFQPEAVIDHWGAQQGGMKDSEGKKSVRTNCDDYTSMMIHNFIVLGRMNKFKRIPLVVLYYFAGSVYLSLLQRKNCIKYVYRGVTRGLQRKMVPTVPYEQLA
jgi:glycosyltransferase involved in cell wall biosynthesis